MAIQIKLWADFAFEQWWLEYEYNADHERNTLPCPIDRLELLTAIYEPALLKNISEIKNLINSVEYIGLEMYEEHRSLQSFYPDIRRYAEQCTEAYNKLHLILMQINRKYNKKGAVKPSAPLQEIKATHSNIQNQMPDF